MNGKSKKRELAYKQLVTYSHSLARLKIKWREFTELIKNNHENSNMEASLKLISVRKQLEEIRESYSDYRDLVHETSEIIDNLFHDQEAFIKSVYRMDKTENDQFNEASFIQHSLDDLSMHNVIDDYRNIDSKYACQEINKLYGTYVEIYQYRIQTKINNSQNYIDDRLRQLLDSISSTKIKGKDKHTRI
jgi:hypothetical protein